MNGVHHASIAGLPHAIAGLVGPPGNAKPPAAKALHLRHERKCREPSLLIERREDFRQAADFNPFTGLEIEEDPRHEGFPSWVREPLVDDWTGRNER